MRARTPLGGSWQWRQQRWLMTAAVLASVSGSSAIASAATWVNNRTTPQLAEIVAIDATGEPGWPYGAEDVAGDGVATFSAAEQMIDIRTAYAATDPTRFWARVYFSDPNSVGAMVTAYVFIDADRNSATGGRAAATEIDPALTTDPTPGGYEYVLSFGSNKATGALWEYRAAQAMFANVNGGSANVAAESGADVDPILIGGMQHGYLQGNVNLSAVALTAVCNANLFVRSVSNGGGDLDAGQWGTCVAADTNADRVPDLVTPPNGCTSDAECPGGGTCVNGACSVPVGCTTDAECAANEQCMGGRCLARPGGTCATTADCGDLVCVGGQCVACTSTSQCAASQACSSTGRCAASVVLAPGEKVEGGAFNCAASRSDVGGPSGRGIALAAALALLARARRKRLT